MPVIVATYQLQSSVVSFGATAPLAVEGADEATAAAL